MMLGIKEKKYHVTIYGDKMRCACWKTIAEYQVTGYQKCVSLCRSRFFTTMEGTVVEEELCEEFGIVESNIDEIECSLGRENVGESEDDFVAAESSYDYDDLFNFEVSVAIAGRQRRIK